MAGEDVGDVGKVGLVRTDVQHAAPAVAEARVCIEQVGGAVQCDDGLARARAAAADEGATGSGADDGVLVGRDGAEHVPHPGRSAGAQAGDEGGLVVERGVPAQPARGEHLVPVVADPAAGPAVPAAAGQAHRVGVGRCEERLSRGGAPAGQQPAARRVVRPSRPMYTGSALSAPAMRPRHRSRPKRRRARNRAVPGALYAESGKEWVLSSPYRPLWTDNLLAKRRRAAYGGTVGPGGSPRARGCSRGTRSSSPSSARPARTSS
jgi:hypothetical protein